MRGDHKALGALTISFAIAGYFSGRYCTNEDALNAIFSIQGLLIVIFLYTWADRLTAFHERYIPGAKAATVFIPPLGIFYLLIRLYGLYKGIPYSLVALFALIAAPMMMEAISAYNCISYR